jgi:uncharacterized Fe-S cluster-containing protein
MLPENCLPATEETVRILPSVTINRGQHSSVIFQITGEVWDLGFGIEGENGDVTFNRPDRC